MPVVAFWDYDHLLGEDGKQGRNLLNHTEVDAELRRVKKDGHAMVSGGLHWLVTVEC